MTTVAGDDPGGAIVVAWHAGCVDVRHQRQFDPGHRREGGARASRSRTWLRPRPLIPMPRVAPRATPLSAGTRLQLMWLASPALPIGGFSYSEVLEAAVAAE